MKALTISAQGGLGQLKFRDDLAIPELRALTEGHIQIAAGALNQLDLFVVAELPGVTPATLTAWRRPLTRAKLRAGEQLFMQGLGSKLVLSIS